MNFASTPAAPHDLVQIARAAMVENTSTQLAFLDRDFNFVCVNSAYAQGCGRAPEELIGRNHFELFPNAENQVIFERVRDTGQLAAFQARPFEFPDQPERGVTYWDWTLVALRAGRGGDTEARSKEDGGLGAAAPAALPGYSGQQESLPVQGLVLSLADVTEQVRAKLANEQSEAKYRNLFAGMREAFALHEIICDAEGKPVDYRFLDANPAFGDLTGLDPATIIGKTVLEVLPGTEPFWIATYGEVAITGKPARFENYSQELDAWFQVAAYSPAPRQFVAIFTDVTERRQMEDELRRARDELQGQANRLDARVRERTAQLTAANVVLQRQAELLENVNDAIISTDRDRCVTNWNRVAEELFGWTAEEAIGRSTGELLPTVFLDCSEQEMYRQLEEQGRWRGEIAVPHKDGHLVYVEATGMVLKDATGQIAGQVSVNRDITARRQGERALRESEERFRTSVESMLDAFAIFTAVRDESGTIVDFRYEYINQAGCSANRLSREETIGRTMLEVLPSHKQTGIFDEYCAVVESSVPMMKESLFYEDVWGGERLLRAFDVRASKLGDGLAVAWRDITERKQAEDELRQSRQQLQAFSRQLVEAQENERRAIARELHDEVGQALTVMKLQVHALNLLANDPDKIAAQARDVLQSIDGIMENLHRLAVDLRPASLDRVGLLPSLQQLAESFEKRTGIATEVATFGLDGHRLAPEVETMVYRVVQEALTNAARHSGASHVGVIVKQRDGRLLTIVEDNGAGFDAEAALHSGRLGLLGMRERADILGGTFAVESVPGAGTTIFVEVPCDC